MKKGLYLSAAIIVLLILGFLVISSSPRTENEAVADTMPNTELTSLSGENIELNEFLEPDVLVVNSWASWCPFCVNELPAFSELDAEFGENVEVVAVNRRENPSEVNGYLSGLNDVGEITFVLDAKDNFYKSIGGFSMPETLFVKPDGTVAQHVRGPLSLEQMREIVNEIIDQ